jgi:hypothetical protein
MRGETCPKCDATMVDGFLVDRRKGPNAELPTWYEGAPSWWWFGALKLGGRARFRVRSRRCRRCGYLESFATEPG